MDIVYHEFNIHGSRGNSEGLEKLLNLCVRYVCGVRKYDHVTPHRTELGLLKLFDRRTLHVANMIHGIIHGNTPNYLGGLITLNTNNARAVNKLIIKRPQTNFHKSSFSIGSPKLWE